MRAFPIPSFARHCRLSWPTGSAGAKPWALDGLFGPTLLVAALAMAPTSVAAQDAPCSDEVYRKFAALEGEWDSTWLARNQLVGRYRFDRESGGCALRQSWTGAPATPGTGIGLIAYSPADRMWHRFWTDDTGTFETMTATAEGPETRWEGDRTDPQDRSRTIGIRIAWRVNPDGTILETYHISRDGRQSWTPFGRFLLRRVEPGAD